jgi:signal transduction histidine kinase
MGSTIEYQLARARSVAGRKPSGRGVVLPDVAAPILRAMQRLHPDKRFVMHTESCDGVVLPLDPVDYAEVLSILLDNAGEWAREQVLLMFTCDAAGGCTARIADDGPGLAEDLLDKAFDVGARFDVNTAGSGLGLAIARDICAAMDTELTLANGAQGLIATVRYAPQSRSDG